MLLRGARSTLQLPRLPAAASRCGGASSGARQQRGIATAPWRCRSLPGAVRHASLRPAPLRPVGSCIGTRFLSASPSEPSPAAAEPEQPPQASDETVDLLLYRGRWILPMRCSYTSSPPPHLILRCISKPGRAWMQGPCASSSFRPRAHSLWRTSSSSGCELQHKTPRFW